MQKKHVTVKGLPETERPYEICEKMGASGLSDAELLAVIIKCGTKEMTSIDLAKELLRFHEGCPGILGLNYMTLQEFMQIKGIGKVKAIQLSCVAELSKRMAGTRRNPGITFKNPETVAHYYMQDLRFLTTEQVRLLMLDAKSRLIKEIILSSGTVNASFSHPRDIFLTAFRHDAVSIILLHNHPSGDPTPSREDIHTTKRILEAGQIIGISLMDHIIIGDNTYVSLKELSLM